MSRPEVSLQNAEPLYEYYKNHRQNRVFARFVAHPLLSRVYTPEITFEDGAEEAIADQLTQNNRLIISPNHLTGDDQYVIVAAAQKVKALRPLRGHAFIPTEPSLSSRPGLKGSLLRWAVDELGSIPIVRLKDLERQKIEITPEILEQYRRAMLLADDVEVKKLVEDGDSMGVFWESERNRIDHTTVQPLKKGPAHTAIRAAKEVGISILPVGMYYGHEPRDYDKLDVPDKREPAMHFGLPIPVEAHHTPEDLVQILHPAMQHCVDIAVRSCLAR